jgi:hypothetical protein
VPHRSLRVVYDEEQPGNVMEPNMTAHCIGWLSQSYKPSRSSPTRERWSERMTYKPGRLEEYPSILVCSTSISNRSCHMSTCQGSQVAITHAGVDHVTSLISGFRQEDERRCFVSSVCYGPGLSLGVHVGRWTCSFRIYFQITSSVLSISNYKLLCRSSVHVKLYT